MTRRGKITLFFIFGLTVSVLAVDLRYRKSFLVVISEKENSFSGLDVWPSGLGGGPPDYMDSNIVVVSVDDVPSYHQKVCK